MYFAAHAIHVHQHANTKHLPVQIKAAAGIMINKPVHAVILLTHVTLSEQLSLSD